jgi:hypothetical protein
MNSFVGAARCTSLRYVNLSAKFIIDVRFFVTERQQSVMSRLSGRPDLNWRPPGPKPGALTGLRYAPIDIDILFKINNLQKILSFSKYVILMSLSSYYKTMKKPENITAFISILP